MNLHSLPYICAAAVLLMPVLTVDAAIDPELPVPKYCPKNEPRPFPGDRGGVWWGQVTAVDRISLTLRSSGDERLRYFMVRHNLLEPRPAGFKGRTGYRLPDVKSGDVVLLQYDRNNGSDTCIDIMIYRRPGGTVPPLPGEDPKAPSHHHEVMQAYQDWEEKGIPIPPEHVPWTPELRTMSRLATDGSASVRLMRLRVFSRNLCVWR